MSKFESLMNRAETLLRGGDMSYDLQPTDIRCPHCGQANLKLDWVNNRYWCEICHIYSPVKGEKR